VLDTGDASALSTLPGHRSKEITIVALANLAKFQGRYEWFLEIKKRYDLKWSTSNSTQFFERFFSEGLSLEGMLQRIQKMMASTPVPIPQILRFGVLTGLRASEVIESVRLLNQAHNVTLPYYNPERQALEHFRYPAIFLRQTKKAYISFVTPEMISGVSNLVGKLPSLNAITLACRRKGIKMEMYLTRKIFASWLRKEGIQPEVVDLLQGRTSQSILTRHYLVPQSSLKDDVLNALEKLQQQL
jgi:intergrase/recombinase